VKTRERLEARRLRADDGLPIKEIARRLGVATSSVSVWVRDVELTAEQQAALLEQNPAYNRQLCGWRVMAARRREARREAQNEGRAVARRTEALHVAGCMLYWAEGAKDRNQVCFSNSDPAMIRLFVRFLRTYFNVSDDLLRMTCYLFGDHVPQLREVERFWLDVAELPPTSLRPSVINRYSISSKRRKRFNSLPYGTCRLVVNRTAVAQHIFGAIQEYGGFERDAWLE
jgi:transposase-like protein